MKICVIGSSKRSKLLAENLKAIGHEIIYISDGKVLPHNINSNYTVLPIPTTLSDGSLNLPNSNSMLIDCIDKDSTIISYNYTSKTHKTIDLSTREDFAYLNAIPTAEGAICTALNNFDTSLYYSNILITGFGRVAKILADRLSGLKCKITIAARSAKDLSLAAALGYNTVDISNLINEVNRFDLIFQTIPFKVLTSDILSKIKESCMIVELSSKSVGTDTEYAVSKELSLINAAALPEKISPITAANILTECVLKIITENPQ